MELVGRQAKIRELQRLCESGQPDPVYTPLVLSPLFTPRAVSPYGSYRLPVAYIVVWRPR
jgi:hypothetical protein